MAGSTVTQTVLTVVTEVDRAKLGSLEPVVAEIARDPAANAVLPLAHFENLHFASLVLVEEAGLEPTLISRATSTVRSTIGCRSWSRGEPAVWTPCTPTASATRAAPATSG